MPVIEMATKEDWEYLGLSPGASVEEIKSAWKRLSRQTHPDAGGTGALFRRVTEAYERVLASVEHDQERGKATAPPRPSAPPKRPSAEGAPAGGAGSKRSEQRKRPSGGVWEPPKWNAPEEDPAEKAARAEAAGWEAERRRSARRRRTPLRSFARILLLSGRWPASSMGVGVGLVMAAAAGFGIHMQMAPGLVRTVLEFVPGAVVVARTIALPARLDV